MRTVALMAKARQATRAQDKLIEIKRKLGILWVVILAIASALFLIMLIHYLRNAQYFPIREVSIRGDYSHISASHLKNDILPYTQSSFFCLDLKALKQRLLEEPWLERAEVQRVWPDQLVIHLKEHKAIAVWNGVSLLAENGTIFSPPLKTFPSHLPMLNAPLGQQDILMKMFKQLSFQFSTLGLSVIELDLTSRLAWYVRLSNGLELILGRDDTENRVHRFIESYTQIIASHVAEINYIDLRYANGFAVKWKNQNG